MICPCAAGSAQQPDTRPSNLSLSLGSLNRILKPPGSQHSECPPLPTQPPSVVSPSTQSSRIATPPQTPPHEHAHRAGRRNRRASARRKVAFALKRGQGCRPFPHPFLRLEPWFLRYASDRWILDEDERFGDIEVPASLRSNGCSLPPECRSRSLRNRFRLRRNIHNEGSK